MDDLRSQYLQTLTGLGLSTLEDLLSMHPRCCRSGVGPWRAATPIRPPRIAVVSGGEFSGSTASLVSAIRRQGCEAVLVRNRPRSTPLFTVAAYAHALWLYGTRFRRYLHRTPTAAKARSKAAHDSIQGLGELDAIIQIGANFYSFCETKRVGTRYAVFTDHVNLLSKQLPEHGVPIPERAVHPCWNTLERAVLQAQDHVFVMGRYVKTSMERDYGVAESGVTAVGAGPNVDLDIERDREVKDHGGQNILFVGKDPIRKGLPVLEEAFSRIARRFPDAHLHVVGCDGQDGERVTYYGRLSGEEPLKRLFYDAQVFVLPSFREPFGIALLEAMWAKCACIGARTGAIPEIIEDGVSGFLMDPGNAAQLADGLTRLLNDPGLIRSLAEQGYRDATLKWRWDLTAKRMLDALFR